MRKISIFSVLLVVLFGFVSIIFAQQTIKTEEAGKYIGQQKTVCGKVASVSHPSGSYTENLTEQPTFLNFNKPFPNQVFTATISGMDRVKFEKPPEMLYSEKEVCVTGIIQSYQGRPEIIVKEPAQIEIK